MKIIEKETVQRILDTADIVDVVSDFVHLKRRGANYMGLCPFHNERTPSFSVSKSKNICKCFSCGKGGSPVNFIMQLEQLSYNEALRYLAKKYNIEIKEREQTDQERELESERESMFAVNEYAMQHFERNIHDTPDGRNIGLAYFLERGINEASIKKFHLGYALEKSNDFYETALRKGFKDKYLLDTGLCIKTDSGRVYDRFKGRVIYPVFAVSGKVVAFGGRTLKKDVAKYVNSPESLIYHKSSQLYGMYQAKSAIVRQDKCILVEGYMDVISMHQSGIENVVASSGTSLTEGQIRMIHRFTENVTVIYDGDAAGIKASLRGIDMLLAEGLDIKVVLLPDGDDPDSFAQKHTSSELEEYIKEHEDDFIRFKTEILLKGENDPLARSRMVNDIIRSIAVIPDQVKRNIYIKDCSRRLDIDELVVSRQVALQIKTIAENEYDRKQKERARQTIANIEQPQEPEEKPEPEEVERLVIGSASGSEQYNVRILRPYESAILKYVVRYGMVTLCEEYAEDGTPLQSVKVIDYIGYELKREEFEFVNKDLKHTFDEAMALLDDWESERQNIEARLAGERSDYISAGEEELRNSGLEIASIERKEKELIASADEKYFADRRKAESMFVEKILISHPDDAVRNIAIELASEKHVLSKVHTRFMKVETEEDRLQELVPRAIYEYKDAILGCQIKAIQKEMAAIAAAMPYDGEKVMDAMKRLTELHTLRSEIAKFLGERILYPRK
ncbi:MAG: DNA primase [Bacteroides sp.]|nr:DNA primase [Bacteroides sp.]MCM1390076.1 DNA primase [Bacteroides sp.]